MSQVSKSIMHELPDGVHRQLSLFRRMVRRIKSTEGILATLCGGMLAYLGVFFLERFVDTSPWLRGLFLASAMIFAVTCLPWMWFRWVWGTRRLNSLARLLKGTYPRLSDSLVSIIELAENREEQRRSPTLIAAAMQQVERKLNEHDLRNAIPHPHHRQWGLVASLPGLILIVLLLSMPHAAWNAWLRFTNPWTETPRFTLTTLEVPAETIVVPYAEPFALPIQLSASSQRKPSQAKAWLGGVVYHATLQSPSHYLFQFAEQFEEQKLVVQCGDDWKTLSIVPTMRPELETIQAKITLPDYLQYAEPIETVTNGGGMSILKGSTLSMELVMNRELREATVDDQSVPVEGNRVLVAAGVVEDSKTAKIAWTDKHGLAVAKPSWLQLRAIEDRPPTIHCQGLNEQRVLLQSDTLSFEVNAEDDYGLQSVGIEWVGQDEGLPGGKPARGEKRVIEGDRQARNLTGIATLSCLREEITPQVLQLRAFTEDAYPGRGRVYSLPFLIKVMSADEHAQWLAEQLQRWKGRIDGVYEEELRLLEENRALRRLDPQNSDRQEMRRKLTQQSQAENANAAKLEAANREGEKLLEQALRNEQVHAKQIEQWSSALKRLNGLAAQQMPELAGKIGEAANGIGSMGTAAQEKEESLAPSLTDSQVSPADRAEANDKGQANDKANSQGDAANPRLTLPKTDLGPAKTQGGKEQPAKPNEPASSPKIDEVVRDHTRLVEEFRKAREQFEALMTDFENSTFIKRLKGFARIQRELANRQNLLLRQSFGLAPAELSGEQQQEVKGLGEAQTAISNQLRSFSSDLEGYQNSNPAANREEVLKEMEKLNMQVKLQEMPERLARNLRGDALHRSEFWADTFDRWAEELAGPAKNGSGGGDEKEKDSLPPALLLDILRIIEDEMDLRDETRSLGQLVPKGKKADDVSEEVVERATSLAVHQMAIQERTLNALNDVKALPKATEHFDEEIGKMSNSIKAMDDASGQLAEMRLGPGTIASETEAIEALLATRRGGRGGGGGSSPGDGSAAVGSTNRKPLELLGLGSNASGKVVPRQIGEGTGKTGRSLPEEYREGLDSFFNGLHRLRRSRP